MKACEVKEPGFYWVLGARDGDYVAEVEESEPAEAPLYAYHRMLDYGEFLTAKCWDGCEFVRVNKPESKEGGA
jgi:hypothetical protein